MSIEKDIIQMINNCKNFTITNPGNGCKLWVFKPQGKKNYGLFIKIGKKNEYKKIGIIHKPDLLVEFFDYAGDKDE